MSTSKFLGFVAAAFASNFVLELLWTRFYPTAGAFAIKLDEWVHRWPGIAVFYLAGYGLPTLIAALIGFPFSLWNRRTPLTYAILGGAVCLFIQFVTSVVHLFLDLFFGFDCTLFGGAECNPVGY
jgi:hypothetical protein